MQNPRLAGRYAKSLMDLALEQNQLEEVHNDILFLQQVCRQSREFVGLLRSPVIHAEKKLAIVNAITEGKLTVLTAAFNRLLILKGREMFLPEILQAFIEQYKKHKNIFTVRLTTAEPASEQVKNAIVSKVQEQIKMKQIDLETAVNPELIGGFTLDLGNTLVDASIAYDLNKIKTQFLNNDFVYKIR
jgi:F-type H+-transporting ATPase subunit delta